MKITRRSPPTPTVGPAPPHAQSEAAERDSGPSVARARPLLATGRLASPLVPIETATVAGHCARARTLADAHLYIRGRQQERKRATGACTPAIALPTALLAPLSSRLAGQGSSPAACCESGALQVPASDTPPRARYRDDTARWAWEPGREGRSGMQPDLGVGSGGAKQDS